MTSPSTLARLAKELRQYVAHDPTCPSSNYWGGVRACNCGLTALQQQLAEELAKEEAQ